MTPMFINHLVQHLFWDSIQGSVDPSIDLSIHSSVHNLMTGSSELYLEHYIISSVEDSIANDVRIKLND